MGCPILVEYLQLMWNMFISLQGSGVPIWIGAKLIGFLEHVGAAHYLFVSCMTASYTSDGN
jgi:hypothetical protein